MQNNKIDSDNNVDIDLDESSEVWSFRNKEELSKNNDKKELSITETLTQKVNQTLIKSTQKKPKIFLDVNTKYYEEESKNLDFFKKSVKKELEIFESERKMQLLNKKTKENNLLNLKMTLIKFNFWKCIFVTKDDLIVNLPNNFLSNTNLDDIGNEYQINMREIDKLVPNDDFIAKLHSEYSKDSN